MKPRFQSVICPPAEPLPGGIAGKTVAMTNSTLAAMSAERIHDILRRMPGEDWSRLKANMQESLNHETRDGDIEVLERIFRLGERLGAQVGGIVLRMVQAISGTPALKELITRANERMRERVRFVLREMPDEEWVSFKAALERSLDQATKAEDLAVVELVFRTGESVSNIETAALALAEECSGRKRIQPDVARRNAMVTVARPGTAKLDPEAAYQAAKRAIEEAEEIVRRGRMTLAYRYVEAAASYKHARNTLFRMVDAILGNRELMAEVERIERELLGVGAVSREQMRWALHRMPLAERMKVLKLIPLNTILMFQAGEGRATPEDVDNKATRNRRMAYDHLVKEQCEEELMATYGLSGNAVKNEMGMILEALGGRPLARQAVRRYLEQVEMVEPMGIDEARRRLKQLGPEQRAAILSRIPNSVWRAKDTMLWHKHLFLDYLSGEWVLAALVDYYNLEKGQSIAGRFRFEGTLSVRGANAAIEGMLRKITDEPELKLQLRLWTGGETKDAPGSMGGLAGSEEASIEELMPPGPSRLAVPLHA